MHDDGKKYLMKRRRYGWGWIPVTWQGWLLLIFQFGIIFTAATFLPTKPAQPTAGELLRFFLILGFALATIVVISLLSGPAPKWRWGKKVSDNPSEDF